MELRNSLPRRLNRQKWIAICPLEFWRPWMTAWRQPTLQILRVALRGDWAGPPGQAPRRHPRPWECRAHQSVIPQTVPNKARQEFQDWHLERSVDWLGRWHEHSTARMSDDRCPTQLRPRRVLHQPIAAPNLARTDHQMT